VQRKKSALNLSESCFQAGRVFKAPEASFRFIKKRFRLSEKMFGQQPVKRESIMQETISISKFKATCLRLLDSVKKTGKSILVTRKGEPIALVTPPPPPPKPEQWLGCMKNRVKITGDIISPALEEKEWEVLRD
jgi:prevent-host-death family protein